MAERLAAFAASLLQGNVADDGGACAEAVRFREELAKLRTDIGLLAAAANVQFEVPIEEIDSIGGLRGCLEVIDATGALEGARLDAAKAVLSVARRLCHRDSAFAPLVKVRQEAERVEAALATPSPERDALLLSLSDGSHSLAQLARLASALSELSDLEWSALEESVKTGFGSAVAIAAARGKLVVVEQPPPAEGSPPAVMHGNEIGTEHLSDHPIARGRCGCECY